MTRIDMAKWRPTPPPRHVLAAAKETFREYFVRFSARAWGLKPRSPVAGDPPAEQGK